MTPQFLRYEAARFRGMAGVANRESSKLRLLAMATDYDARAKIADDMTKPMPEEATPSGPSPELEEAVKRLTELDQGGALLVEPNGRTAREPKEASLVERRPIGRQR